jgi:hypothetical protein
MSGVAEQLGAELRDRFRGLPLEDRLRLVLDLGARDVGLYADARCVDRATAASVLSAARRRGRRPSRCLEPDAD